MKVLLVVILALAGSVYSSDFCMSEECGCCWPVPESCCPGPTTTTPEPTPPTPTPVVCPCEADVTMILDRSGSIEEIDNLKTFVNSLLSTDDFRCMSTALISFSKKVNVEYDFSAPEATNTGLAMAAVSAVAKAKGDTSTGLALTDAIPVVNGDQVDAGENVVLLFTDGGSDDKQATRDGAEALRDGTDARVCIIGMDDPSANPSQMSNRMGEFTAILDRSNVGSRIVDIVDFNSIVPGQDLIDKIIACICDQPPPTPPPFTDCDCVRDVQFILDRSGSIEEFENLKTFAVNMLNDLEEECFSTAMLTFAKVTEVTYSFSDPAATDRSMADGLIALLPNSRGDTFTGSAFSEALIENGKQNGDGFGCDVVVFFSDGGSDTKQDTINAAATLAADTGAWFCLIRMLDSGEQPQQTANREAEFDNILAAVVGSAPNSMRVVSADFNLGVPGDDTIAAIRSCICKDC